MNEYRYYLDRKSKKFKCVSCGDKSFTKYIDRVTGDYLPDEYGKCDHANRCDYHRNPYKAGYNREAKEERPRIVWIDGQKVYFQFEYLAELVEAIKKIKGRKFDGDRKVWYFEVPNLTEDLAVISQTYGFTVIRVKQPKTVLLPETVLQKTLKGYEQNKFVQNIINSQPYPFNPSDVETIVGEYYLGTTISPKDEQINGAITFPFIDVKGGVRAIQVKNFDSNNHTTSTTFIHSIMQQYYRDSQKDVPDWLVEYGDQDKKVSCLFGEHLLTKYPNNSVALVEAPKTAIIGSLYFGLPSDPRSLLWLAVYNKDSFSKEKVSVLKGRKVVVFPDLGAHDSWSKKNAEWDLGFKMSDLLERSATYEEKQAGLDLADILVNHDWRLFRSCDNTVEQYPSLWDQPSTPTDDEIKWRLINWLENLEGAILNRNNQVAAGILKEIEVAGYIDSIPEDLLIWHAPTAMKLITHT